MPAPFIFHSYDYAPDIGKLRLYYAFDGGATFCEEISFPKPSRPLTTEDTAILDRLFQLLFLFAGVSYYKAYAPQTLICKAFAIAPETAALVEKLYKNGLGEFSVCNKITVSPRFDDVSGLTSTPLPRKASSTVLVPVGGGKDSVVALECLRHAGYKPTLFALHSPGGLATPIQETIAVSGLPAVAVQRRLDPALHTLPDSMNGHVPITAILSVIALCTAVMNGHGAVIMANEHSASAPNLVQDGLDINHQYSKSLEFEEDLGSYIKSYVCNNLTYVSLLRPLTEVAIAQKFSTLQTYHPVFRSCNTAFRQDADKRGTHWCCDCPKCRFVFLALAPFMTPESMISIFGQNMLNDPDQCDGFAALCGLDSHKPFECVGETYESALLILHLSALTDWQDTPVVRALVPRLSALYPNSAMDFVSLFDLKTPHRVPHDMIEALYEVG